MTITIPQWLKTTTRIFISTFGPLFTVIGLLLAIYQVQQSRGQEKEISSIVDQSTKQQELIKDIAGSISTKYVGTFPDNMEAINKLISSTKRSLLIVVDVPAYGHFSNPMAHNDYRHDIEHLVTPIGKTDVKIVCYTEAARRRNMEKQFRIKTIEQIRQKESYKRFFDYWKTAKPQPSTKDEFYDLLTSENNELLTRLRALNVPIHETTNDLPVFIWLSDEREAIFSFYNYGDTPREVSFQTNDQKLINVLQEIAKEAMEEPNKGSTDN